MNDNSVPEVLDYSEFVHDKRFKLFVEDRLFSMTENWLRALSQAQGDWIVFIGADDGLVVSNLPEFLNYLETCASEIVLAHSAIFSYEIDDKYPYLEVPVLKPSKNAIPVKFPFRLAALFPQLRNTVLPIPYNKATVKRHILDEVIVGRQRIPSISPDDFMGHFIAQKCLQGVYFDTLVFIEGISERSNGRSFFHNPTDLNVKEFKKDSLSVQKNITLKYGLYCFPAMALQHSLDAWEEVHGKKPTPFLALMSAWCWLTCLDPSHHPQFFFRASVNVRRIAIDFLSKAIRRLWIIKHFGNYVPFRNKQVMLGRGATIRDAATLLSEY